MSKLPKTDSSADPTVPAYGTKDQSSSTSRVVEGPLCMNPSDAQPMRVDYVDSPLQGLRATVEIVADLPTSGQHRSIDNGHDLDHSFEIIDPSRFSGGETSDRDRSFLPTFDCEARIEGHFSAEEKMPRQQPLVGHACGQDLMVFGTSPEAVNLMSSRAAGSRSSSFRGDWITDHCYSVSAPELVDGLRKPTEPRSSTAGVDAEHCAGTSSSLDGRSLSKLYDALTSDLRAVRGASSEMRSNRAFVIGDDVIVNSEFYTDGSRVCGLTPDVANLLYQATCLRTRLKERVGPTMAYSLTVTNEFVEPKLGLICLDVFNKGEAFEFRDTTVSALLSKTMGLRFLCVPKQSVRCALQRRYPGMFSTIEDLYERFPALKMRPKTKAARMHWEASVREAVRLYADRSKILLLQSLNHVVGGNVMTRSFKELSVDDAVDLCMWFVKSLDANSDRYADTTVPDEVVDTSQTVAADFSKRLRLKIPAANGGAPKEFNLDCLLKLNVKIVLDPALVAKASEMEQTGDMFMSARVDVEAYASQHNVELTTISEVGMTSDILLEPRLSECSLQKLQREFDLRNNLVLTNLTKLDRSKSDTESFFNDHADILRLIRDSEDTKVYINAIICLTQLNDRVLAKVVDDEMDALRSEAESIRNIMMATLMANVNDTERIRVLTTRLTRLLKRVVKEKSLEKLRELVVQLKELNREVADSMLTPSESEFSALYTPDLVHQQRTSEEWGELFQRIDRLQESCLNSNLQSEDRLSLIHSLEVQFVVASCRDNSMYDLVNIALNEIELELIEKLL